MNSKVTKSVVALVTAMLIFVSAFVGTTWANFGKDVPTAEVGTEVQQPQQTEKEPQPIVVEKAEDDVVTDTIKPADKVIPVIKTENTVIKDNGSNGAGSQSNKDNSQSSAESNKDNSQSGNGNNGNTQTPVVPDTAVTESIECIVNSDSTLAQAVTMTSEEGITATVPAGVKVNAGAKQLTLTITSKDESDSDVNLEETEKLDAYDVHIEGVAKDNTTPIAIDLGEVLNPGLNKGNLAIYHVENGETVKMSEVDSAADFTAHNQFAYNPENGAVAVAMTGFSEVAVVSEEAKWEGNFDYSWYNTTDKNFTIANADQLAAFGAIVGGMNGQTQDSFAGKTVKLISDINLGDGEDDESNNGVSKIFYPIGYYNDEGTYEKTNVAITSSVSSFEGTFDGNGHTISNFYQNTWEMKGDDGYYDKTLQYYNDAMGLFGYVLNGTVKNLTVDNFSSDGEYTPTGVIAAYADGNSTFENIAITNCNPRVYNTGNGGIIGVAGDTSAADDDHITLKNITVDNSNKISALWGSWDVACGGLVGMYRGNVDGSGNATGDTISFENCHVSAQIDVYNDVCANYQYYAYRYAGMIIGSVRHNTTKEVDGVTKTVPNMTGISAKDCTVNYGDWNDYYYCEFEKNTMASYSEDYQFSRVPHSELNFTDSNGNGVVDEDERASVKGCNHTHTAEENHQAVYLPFHQLFTGYSWGVSSIGLEKYSGIVTNLDITEGDQEKSEVKFETKFTGDFLYRVGNANAVEVGSLFTAKDGVTISNSGVVVSIDKVDENSNVSGTFKADTSDWTKGTIQFNGTGVVKVTIQDYNFCTPTVLYLEVVDAVNATTATSATANNVVLLNDISSGFTVSGDYTLYGNGFTLTYSGDGQYLNNGLKQGIVTVSENGTLDNVRIKASIYPRAYMYYGLTQLGDYVQGGPSSVEGDKTRYHYQLSAVAAKGNATISNCYIYGGRTNIFVDTGDVTIKDSVLECGTVANIQMQSTEEYTVTLENVTTIQHQINATIGDTSKVMLGAGVLVGPDTNSNPKIVLNGKFKQYNWVTEEDANAVSSDTTKMIIDAALNAETYNHTVNGKTASNLGIIYMNTADVAIENDTGLPYIKGDITITPEGFGGNSEKGQVYSLQNATAEQIFSDYKNADRETEQGDYMPTFDFALGDQEISYDGSEDKRYLYGDAKGVTALYQDGNDPLTLDLTKLATIYKYDGINYAVTAVCKDSSGNELTAENGVVTLATQGEYTLKFTVTDNIFYDKNGETVEKSVERTYTVPLKLTVKEANIKNAVVNITETALDGVYNTVNLTDYELRIKFLDAISVTDYDNKGTGSTVNLSSNISSATLTPSGVNVFTTASTITITYTDGRVLTVNLSNISGSSPGTKTAKVNTSGSVYFTTEGALDNKPTEAKNQNKCTITSVSYKGNSGSTVTNDTDVTVTWELGSSSGGGTCLAEGTLITLADGTKRAVEDLRKGDMVMAVDHTTGEIVSRQVIIVVKTESEHYENTFVFDDGTELVTINEHGIFDLNLNKYVNIDHLNYNEFLGHNFVSVDTAGNIGTKKLVDVKSEYTTGYKCDIVSEGTLSYVAEDTLSVTHVLVDIINTFEFGENLAFDQNKMIADIQQYGLYTYDEWEEYCDRTVFDQYNIPIMKVGVEKGLYTQDYIIYLINKYVLDDNVQVLSLIPTEVALALANMNEYGVDDISEEPTPTPSAQPTAPAEEPSETEELSDEISDQSADNGADDSDNGADLGGETEEPAEELVEEPAEEPVEELGEGAEN